MTDRVFEGTSGFEVSDGGRSVEVYVCGSGGVDVKVIEEAGYDSQRASFVMTAEEATLLKEFLIRKGY